MEQLAAYWNAMAVRRNQKTPFWWVAEGQPDLRQELGEPALVVQPTGPEVARNGVQPREEG